MISKRTILLLMAIWVFAAIYYQEYKKKQKLMITPTLNSISIAAISGTDPVGLHDVSSAQVASKIYEGLYTYHPFQRPFQLVPNLAEGMPIISTDGLTYTFKIKQGVLFQDDLCFPNGKGRELKAADFVFSLKRLVDPKHIAPYVGLINGKIKGLDVWKQQADYAQEVEGLKALDDYTLQITLIEPWVLFLHFLAMFPTYVVPQEAVIHYGREFVNHPVGTGPFMLEGGFNPQAKQLTLIKNPTFREKLFPTEGHSIYQPMIDAYGGKRLPLVDKVVTDIITEEQPRWLKMENGELDMQEAGPALLFSLIDDKGQLLPKLSKKELLLYKSPSARTELFIYNHDHQLFKNSYLRQAMSMAFNREDYNQRFYRGTAQVAQSLVPPMLMGENMNALVSSYGYDLERAKKYLAHAGYPGDQGLPVITLDVSEQTSHKDRAEFFAKCMADIGIKIKVVTNIWAQLLTKVDKRATMMHLLTWSGDFPDPSTFLELISDKRLVGLQYENAQFNTLLHQAITTANDLERQQLYVALNNMAAEEVPMIYAVHPSIQVVHYNWVKNVASNDFCSSLDEYIAVDMEHKVKATK